MPVYVCISFVTYEHPLYRFIVLHRGRFVYCPFLLVRFTLRGDIYLNFFAFSCGYFCRKRTVLVLFISRAKKYADSEDRMGGKKMDQCKIGRLIRQPRREKGLTQEELAERFRVSARTVSRWESGGSLR